MAAQTLNIDIEMISVKGSNNLATPNNSATGHSITEEYCGFVRIQLISITVKDRVIYI